MSGLNFQSVVQQVNAQARELRQQERAAKNKKSEIRGVLSKLKTELQSLSPQLEALGEKIFNSIDPTINRTEIRAAFDKAKRLKVDLSEAQAKKVAREEAKKSFWGKIKAFMGDVFDPDQTQNYEEQLKGSYIALAEAVLVSDGDSDLKKLAPKVLLGRMPELKQSISSYDEQRKSIDFELASIAKKVDSLVENVKRSIDTAKNITEVKQGLEEFDAESSSELLKYAEYSFNGLEMDALTACAYMKAANISGAYYIVNSKILSTPASGNAKVSALTRIACQFIETQENQKSDTSSTDTEENGFMQFFNSVGEQMLLGNLLFNLDKITEPTDADVKARGWIEIACQLVKYKRTSDFTQVMVLIDNAKPSQQIRVEGLYKIALKQIECQQFDEARKIADRIYILSADKDDKMKALTEIVKNFLEAGQIDVAQNINRMLIARL
jgi:hypothetical protein